MPTGLDSTGSRPPRARAPASAAPGRLLGVVYPAVLGGSLLPARRQLILTVRVVQAGVAESCHGGDTSIHRVTSATHSTFNRAARIRGPLPPTARACALLHQPIRSCNPVSYFRGDWREKGRSLRREVVEAQKRPKGPAAGRKDRNGSETGISFFTLLKGACSPIHVSGLRPLLGDPKSLPHCFTQS